ncbi:MAG TPA: hypothetical protein VGP15_09355 [Burkholderiales bacterium]|jgi:uncharacterized membrane protein|nr:hypothetical protein [Burkholderiales bacterium]
MADITLDRALVEPRQNLVTLTHVMYALHAFSAVMGILTPALIITSFLTGWPSIIAVIVNYVKRDEVRGTYLESHFGWQLRTFWYAVLWLVVIGVLVMTIVGIVLALPIAFGVGIWVIYRIVRGWMALAARKPMPLPQ